jgi:hypothetical protein
MKPSTNSQIKGTLHAMKDKVKHKAGQVTDNPLRSVPPSTLLMVLKAVSPAVWRTSPGDMKKLLETQAVCRVFLRGPSTAPTADVSRLD